MSKHVIITGTSRGIGFELVKLFAKAGHKVLALSRNPQPTNNLHLDGVTSVAFDLTKPEGFIWVEDYIQSNWEKVDILINNAGAHYGYTAMHGQVPNCSVTAAFPTEPEMFAPTPEPKVLPLDADAVYISGDGPDGDAVDFVDIWYDGGTWYGSFNYNWS